MKDLTQGSVLKHLVQMAAFLAVSMAAQTLYLLADLYWVGRLGKEAIAAVGVAGATSTEQSSGGEDFAWYLEEVPGAMSRLGVWSGEGPMRDLHQPTFDLDERALPIGVRVLVLAGLASLA